MRRSKHAFIAEPYFQIISEFSCGLGRMDVEGMGIAAGLFSKGTSRLAYPFSALQENLLNKIITGSKVLLLAMKLMMLGLHPSNDRKQQWQNATQNES
jgi:hypothetical protein